MLPKPTLALVCALLVLVGCSPNSTPPAPAPSAAASARPGLRCQGTDHGLNVLQLGWAFCYPSTWHFRERDVPTTVPAGVDTTLDIVGEGGFFGFMIIGSYDRRGAANLTEWLAANAPDDQAATSIHWGNAVEAVQVTGQLRRYAMTRSRVYFLSEREGEGNLDLDAAMTTRLPDWYFAF